MSEAEDAADDEDQQDDLTLETQEDDDDDDDDAVVDGDHEGLDDTGDLGETAYPDIVTASHSEAALLAVLNASATMSRTPTTPRSGDEAPDGPEGPTGDADASPPAKRPRLATPRAVARLAVAEVDGEGSGSEDVDELDELDDE
ncbi:hypothetical protein CAUPRSCDRAFT_10905 [Caulochytrium protostelioides]|nr:hypothetical protein CAUPRSCDRAFT_10905 [Caulochytrium protostelioides]